MPNELSVIETGTDLSIEEKNEINTSIDRIIAAHKGNRTEINRLVFESVAAMTEADEAQSELSNKGFFSRLWGGLTGSNQKLQNKINENRAIAQYASQQTLQKLAEQNLMSFDLITAVNNKLNASINATKAEFQNIYDGLSKFLRHNRNELARIETRLSKVERNVNLLNWQNSIEYQDFNGEEYIDMDDTKKIVCLVRDFFEITKGNWETTDILLLKTAMSTIDISPKMKINYYDTLKEIVYSDELKEKLFGGERIGRVDDPGCLIAMGTMKKLEVLESDEKYIIDTINGYLTGANVKADNKEIISEVTKNYISKLVGVDVDMEVDSFDFMLDLLYNLKQGTDEGILELSQPVFENKLQDGINSFLRFDFDNALNIFSELAEAGNARAMYFLGEIYCWAFPMDKRDNQKADMWREKGAELGDPLCGINMIYKKGGNDQEKQEIFVKYSSSLKNMAEEGNVFAADELGNIYMRGVGVDKDYNMAMKYHKCAAEGGFWLAMNQIGNSYYNQENYEEANKWYRCAGEAGYDWGWYNLGNNYYNGEGVAQDYEKAIEYYKKAYELNGGAKGQAANIIGDTYNKLRIYEEANKWYRCAGEAGYDWGWYNLGNNYHYAECGVAQDYEKAIEYYKKAYELNGEAKGGAATRIARAYRSQGNKEEAAKW